MKHGVLLSYKKLYDIPSLSREREREYTQFVKKKKTYDSKFPFHALVKGIST